jgi:hypothetical protein
MVESVSGFDGEEPADQWLERPAPGPIESDEAAGPVNQERPPVAASPANEYDARPNDTAVPEDREAEATASSAPLTPSPAPAETEAEEGDAEFAFRLTPDEGTPQYMLEPLWLSGGPRETEPEQVEQVVQDVMNRWDSSTGVDFSGTPIAQAYARGMRGAFQAAGYDTVDAPADENTRTVDADGADTRTPPNLLTASEYMANAYVRACIEEEDDSILDPDERVGEREINVTADGNDIDHASPDLAHIQSLRAAYGKIVTQTPEGRNSDEALELFEQITEAEEAYLDSIKAGSAQWDAPREADPEPTEPTDDTEEDSWHAMRAAIAEVARRPDMFELTEDGASTEPERVQQKIGDIVDKWHVIINPDFTTKDLEDALKTAYARAGHNVGDTEFPAAQTERKTPTLEDVRQIIAEQTRANGTTMQPLVDPALVNDFWYASDSEMFVVRADPVWPGTPAAVVAEAAQSRVAPWADFTLPEDVGYRELQGIVDVSESQGGHAALPQKLGFALAAIGERLLQLNDEGGIQPPLRASELDAIDHVMRTVAEVQAR